MHLQHPNVRSTRVEKEVRVYNHKPVYSISASATTSLSLLLRA
jgi:hypothetical protein